MNTLTTQELERRGLAAVAEALQAGPVRIVEDDRPRFVVLTVERYRDLLEAEDEAYVARVQASLADVEAGQIRRGTAEDAIRELGLED
jgi:PHD/YefM family antitoxin component YafN of YafNO toxin-antitoxin module